MPHMQKGELDMNEVDDPGAWKANLIEAIWGAVACGNNPIINWDQLQNIVVTGLEDWELDDLIDEARRFDIDTNSLKED
jgi:hypothetical protein